MANLSRSEIIKTKPIGEGLDNFRDSFNLTCQDLGISSPLDAWDQIGSEGCCQFTYRKSSLTPTDLQNLVVNLLTALAKLPAARLLPSSASRSTLRTDLLRLSFLVASDDFDIDRAIPLLKAVLKHRSDEDVWSITIATVTESTPPRSLPFHLQTPILRNTSSFVNSSEHRKYVDDVLKEELGLLHVGIPGFYEAFFGRVEGLEARGTAVFKKCKEGDNPLYAEKGGWRGWPEGAKESQVLEWFDKLIRSLLGFAKEHGSAPKIQRRLVEHTQQPLQGSTADRKLDIGIVDDLTAGKSCQCHWSHILVPGELKSNPNTDIPSKAWLDLGRYVREVFAAQDTRRFVLGFTLCGPIMRLWEFDRVGGIASSPFDINKDGLQFVSAMLGYLWMNEEQLGFDPTILTSDGIRYIEVVRNEQTERLVLDGLMKRAHCVAGRATNCWKAHREGDSSKRPLVIKDSWQYPEREEEGALLREATEKGVVNIARYYHHQTVCVGGQDDDICNIRKGLDITTATNYKPESLIHPGAAGVQASTRKGRSASRKRSSTYTDATLPPRKRTCSSSPTKGGKHPMIQNRVHRRVITSDYGKAIYKASSRAAMLTALKGGIEGYESLHTKAGILQRDVSIGNVLLNEEDDNPSWPAFLIDLDLAIKEKREEPSGARGKTGTRAFMSIGVLLGENHSAWHDFESFFWLLFWICIHYNGPNKESRVVERFDKWNLGGMKELAEVKKGTVNDEEDFLETAEDNFSLYYQPLVPWVNRLRKVVFPGGRRRKAKDEKLSSQMMDILQEAIKDPKVLAE